jgi:DHA3 family macrolide efflux protein-like MFS transporter
MRNVWAHRALRYIFIANLVSMVGSGMNTAAVTWSILQTTHSEVALGTLVALQTLPAVLLLPFSGVIIDREDRRHLVMGLDAGRAIIIVLVAFLVFTHRVHVWHLYAMNVLVALGFWMFWPTVTALIQELTPQKELVGSNSLLMAGVQGGWVLAGSVVGFMYNHIGLGGVLLIDIATYVVSFCFYFGVRKGRHVVPRDPAAEAPNPDAWKQYWHELREGLHLIRDDRHILLIGLASALFTTAMLTQGVITAPLSERILHAGAAGYGWLNAGWAIGAFLSVTYAMQLIQRVNARWAATVCLGVLAACLYVLPYSAVLVVSVLLYFVMGSGRGLGGISINSEVMELVPPRFMGRVQNTFYFIGTGLQIVTALLVGSISHRVGLKYGFAIIGTLYVLACITAATAAMHGRHANRATA